MSFELKHFTPEQLAKLSALNPDLYEKLGLLSVDPEQAEKDYQEALRLNTETWTRLEKAYLAREEAYKEYVKAKKGKPLFTRSQLLAMLLFFCLLLVLI